MDPSIEERARQIREQIGDPSEDEILDALKMIYEASPDGGDMVLLGHVVNPAREE